MAKAMGMYSWYVGAMLAPDLSTASTRADKKSLFIKVEN
jgi:hypothetical protein